jgi:feruloyl esterase
VLQKPDADLAKIDIGEAVQMADQKFGYINHTNPDLSGFIQRGGKLLIYHGWNDPDVPVFNSINYYSTFVDMLQRTGKMNHADALAQAQKSVRLFTAPGMGHCGGGPGPNSFDTVKTLDQWVDQSVAPEKIVATHVGDGETSFSRPLCPYPQYAQYSGKGDRKDAASWTCVNEHWNWALYDRYFYAPDLAPKERQ